MRYEATEIRFAFKMDDLETEIANLILEKERLERQDRRRADHTIAELQYQVDAISTVLLNCPSKSVDLRTTDPARMPHVERWKSYCAWKQRAFEILQEKVSELEAQCRLQVNKLKDVDTLDTAEMIRGADIVGITTTGAARQRALIAPLESKIGKRKQCSCNFRKVNFYFSERCLVIVEEAAEVLEAHVITALSPSCQHLILIGIAF